MTLILTGPGITYKQYEDVLEIYDYYNKAAFKVIDGDITQSIDKPYMTVTLRKYKIIPYEENTENLHITIKKEEAGKSLLQDLNGGDKKIGNSEEKYYTKINEAYGVKILDNEDEDFIIYPHHQVWSVARRDTLLIVDLLNKQHEENITLTRQVLGFKLFTDDLKTENKQLKQALREQLEVHGNKPVIETLDKLFQLNYNDWKNNPYYEDWDETLTLKELQDLYER